MYYMQQEIYEQPSIIERLERLLEPKLIQFRTLFKTKSPKHIVLAARGSSDNACQYFRYLEEIYVGLPVSFAAPSVISMYQSKMIYDQALVIGVSQSGQAQDVLQVMKQAKEQGALVISITNDLTSPMALLADISFHLHANKELSVAATKTFTTELYILAKLVNVMSEFRFDKEFKQIPYLMNQVFDVEESIQKAAFSFYNSNETYILARGPLYAIAQEGALKLLETTYIHAKAYSIADFHHGPFAAVDDKSQIIIFLEKGVMYQDGIDMINKIELAKGKLVIFTNDKDFTNRNQVIYLNETNDITSALIFSVAIQLFAYHVALYKGLNPDLPRGLKKVTITK